jgi:hypothetical protein
MCCSYVLTRQAIGHQSVQTRIWASCHRATFMAWWRSVTQAYSAESRSSSCRSTASRCFAKPSKCFASTFSLWYDEMCRILAVNPTASILIQKVPPIALDLVSRDVGDFDMSSVTEVFTGAAPLDAQVAWVLLMLYPRWKIRQAYGMTSV